MTTKEAIELLNKLYFMADITDVYGDMDDSEPYEIALSMAIKALERESKLKEVIDTLQVWIATADDEYDREEMGRVCGLKEALHLIKKIDEQDEEKAESEVSNAT